MLTIKQAAAKLNVHTETIRRLIKSEKIKAVSLSDSKYSRFRIDEKEIDDFIASRS